jgi:hypothetical protein
MERLDKESRLGKLDCNFRGLRKFKRKGGDKNGKEKKEKGDQKTKRKRKSKKKNRKKKEEKIKNNNPCIPQGLFI